MPLYPQSPNLPSLEVILNQVRALTNDSFAGTNNIPGEGQIITDTITPTGGSTYSNPMVLSHLNSAIRTMYRKLRMIGDPTLIGDNYILKALPVVNGPLGPSQVDPTVQTYLDSTGYFDGSTYWNQWKLPKDMLEPLRLWERNSFTTDTFQEMNETENGLGPASQIDRFYEWEWRNGRINFHGCTGQRDIRIRYNMTFPTFFSPQVIPFATTFIPILDCNDYVAMLTASAVSMTLANPTAAQLFMTEATNALFDLRNQRVRRAQMITYKRRAYDDSDTAQELDVYGI